MPRNKGMAKQTVAHECNKVLLYYRNDENSEKYRNAYSICYKVEKIEPKDNRHKENHNVNGKDNNKNER